MSAFAAVLGAASIMPNEREAVQHALQHTFQIASFRSNQASIVQAAMAGVDTIVLMATGSGKSLCYQLPAVVQSISAAIGNVPTLLRTELRARCASLLAMVHNRRTTRTVYPS